MSALLLSVICVIFVIGAPCAGHEYDLEKVKNGICVEKNKELSVCCRKILVPMVDKIESTGCNVVTKVCGREMATSFCEYSVEEIKSCHECLMKKLEGDDLDNYKKLPECLS
ncbi:uncharacterized protein [Parasteatoda tepidariorum]|uniref:uncharacterized protein n=1 Tax=Parasteatoda tepidariorum TaxID=114398 RepID=UPI001C728151|nr:uncharacterized protein LOC122269730 [Parasteatoda tepidariorum]